MKRLLLVLAVLAGAVLVLPEFASAGGRVVQSRRVFVGPRGGTIVRERNVVSPAFVAPRGRTVVRERFVAPRGVVGRSVIVAPHGAHGAFFVPRGGVVVPHTFGVAPTTVFEHAGGNILFVPNGFGGFTAIQRSPFIGNGAVFVGPPFGF